MRHALIVVLFMMVTVIPARIGLAVTNGQPDGSGHPYVGVAIQGSPDVPESVVFCSGALISPRLFVTAAHCFDPSQPVYVSFKSEPPFGPFPGGTWVTGAYYRDPDWCGLGCIPGLPEFDTHDVAVVVLEADTNPGGYAELPTVGLVDTLNMMQAVDLVGYGAQGFVRGGGQPTEVILATRYYAASQLIDANFEQSGEYIRLTANPAQGKGGTCFGDSGGPDLLGNTNIILAINSYVTNGNCGGVTYSNRIDLQYALDFITGPH